MLNMKHVAEFNFIIFDFLSKFKLKTLNLSFSYRQLILEYIIPVI